MRRIPRKDANHQRVVLAFIELGCSVLDLAAVGNGCPDLLVARHGKMKLVEIKDGEKCPSGRKLTKHQSRFHALWNSNVAICESPAQAVEIVNAL